MNSGLFSTLYFLNHANIFFPLLLKAADSVSHLSSMMSANSERIAGYFFERLYKVESENALMAAGVAGVSIKSKQAFMTSP